VPAGGNELPSAVLASSGGGLFVTDPRSTKRLQTFEKVFQFDVELPAAAGVAQLGARAHVQFDHGAQPLAGQWYRSVRQLFLSHFGV
jgi:putative peptide zinc metalloprotease protein